MKYTQQDKARILRVTTRTLQRWRYTKPELYAIIEAGFKHKEMMDDSTQKIEEINDLLQKATEGTITKSTQK